MGLVIAPVVYTGFGYLIAGLALVVLAYVIVRAASFAHFRTKLEYLRSVLKELHGGRQNGQE